MRCGRRGCTCCSWRIRPGRSTCASSRRRWPLDGTSCRWERVEAHRRQVALEVDAQRQLLGQLMAELAVRPTDADLLRQITVADARLRGLEQRRAQLEALGPAAPRADCATRACSCAQARTTSSGRLPCTCSESCLIPSRCWRPDARRSGWSMANGRRSRTSYRRYTSGTRASHSSSGSRSTLPTSCGSQASAPVAREQARHAIRNEKMPR
jgi:hypothetical protein